MDTVSKLDIWNRALGRIKAGQVTDPAENSLEARECRRFYPAIISSMLEGPNDWSFSIQRVALAQKTNDRTSEWAFAYALPSNLGQTIRVLPDMESLGLSIPVPLPGQPYAEVWASTNLPGLEAPFIIEGTTLYTNVGEVAFLDFIINDVDGVNVGALVSRAIEMELAVALAVPVKGDRQREQQLIPLAEAAWQRAIAEDRNRQPEETRYISESMIARHGGQVD